MFGWGNLPARGGSGCFKNLAVRKVAVGAFAAVAVALLFPTSSEAGWDIAVGAGPVAVAVDGDTGYAYVVSSGDKSLSTLAPTPAYPKPRYSVVNTVALSNKPTDVAVSRTYDKVYVAVPGSQRIQVADLSGNLVGQIDTGKKTKPTFLAVDDANGVLYVANQQEKKVAVVDIKTDTLLERIAAAVTADGFAFHPGLGRIYVSDLQSKTVRSFDPSTGTQVAMVTLSEAARALFADTQRNLIYAALPSSFAVLDASTLAVSAYVPTPSAPGGFALDYPNARLLVTYTGSASVGIWDADTMTELLRAPVGTTPRGIAVFEGDTRALVANSGSDTVSVIDTLTGASSGYTATIDRPSALWVSTSTGRIYVGHYQIDPSDPVSLDAPLEVLSLASGDQVATVGGIGNVFPWGFAENSSASRLYVSRTYAGTVAVIDTATNGVVTEIPVAGLPRALLFDPSTGRLFVTGMFTRDVTVIDTSTNSVVGSVQVGSESAGMALDPATGKVFVAVESAGQVVAVDAATGAVLGSGSVGGKPLGVAYSATTNRVYVANFETGELQVLDGTTLAVVDAVSFGAPVHTVRVSGSRLAVASWEGATTYVIDESTLQTVAELAFDTPVDFSLRADLGYLYQTAFGASALYRVSVP